MVITATGGTVVAMRKFDAEQALALVEKHRATHSQWVPTMFVRMLKLPDDVRLGFDVSSLRIAIHAAAPCPVEVKQQMIDWWGPILFEYYAATEAHVDHAAGLAGAPRVGGQGRAGRPARRRPGPPRPAGPPGG
jgi:fatty-acyl-CoA synthase